jgi:predicted transport protein
MTTETMTERQKAWMASLTAGLERETGRTLDQWAEIARACPETRPRARLAWMKDQFGLGQNRASVILAAAFPSDAGWKEPDALADTLWDKPELRAVFEAVKAEIVALPDVVIGQRKTYTAFSRGFQFAAMRPDKGSVILGLAVPPEAALDLVAPARSVWSERLKSETRLTDTRRLPDLIPSIKRAWDAA